MQAFQLPGFLLSAGTKVTFSWTSKAPRFEVRWRKGDDNYEDQNEIIVYKNINEPVETVGGGGAPAGGAPAGAAPLPRVTG